MLCSTIVSLAVFCPRETGNGSRVSTTRTAAKVPNRAKIDLTARVPNAASEIKCQEFREIQDFPLLSVRRIDVGVSNLTCYHIVLAPTIILMIAHRLL